MVAGWPDDEGNAVEVVRGLHRRYHGRIYWLLSDTGYRGPDYAARDLAASPRIIRVRKRSLLALWKALTAETTFFTHGLVTAVPPPANRLVVNVWHGDGPKIAQDTDLIRSTVVVAGTALWGAMRTKRFSLPATNVAFVGNPRIDQFTAAPRAEVLSKLGLDPERQLILWLPTYRVASGPHGRSWEDGESLSDNSTAQDIVKALSAAAHEFDVQLAVKPHPLDADDYGRFALAELHHGILKQRGVTFYQLLGAADAVISDVSSVWVDFLALDRPVGLSAPDLEELQHRRALNVEDLASLFPGPIIETAQDAHRFVETVATDPTALRPSDHPGFARIGVLSGNGATDRLLDWLDDFQRARQRDPLFTR